MAALAVADVEVDVVGVGLPGQHEAQRGLGLRPAAGLLQPLADVSGPGRLGARPGGGHQSQILGEDPAGPGEAALGITASGAGRQDIEGLGRAAGLDQREGQQAVAGGMIGPLGDRLTVAVDGQRQGSRAAHPFQPVAGEPAQVGPTREQIDQRAVGAGGQGQITHRLGGLAQRHQGQHVPGGGIAKRERPGQRRGVARAPAGP